MQTQIIVALSNKCPTEEAVLPKTRSQSRTLPSWPIHHQPKTNLQVTIKIILHLASARHLRMFQKIRLSIRLRILRRLCRVVRIQIKQQCLCLLKTLELETNQDWPVINCFIWCKTRETSLTKVQWFRTKDLVSMSSIKTSACKPKSVVKSAQITKISKSATSWT